MIKLIGRGRLPKQSNLNRLNSEQLRNVLARFGIKPIDIRNQMLREFAKPAAQIRHIQKQGMVIDEAMRNQLRGQIKRINTSLQRRMVNKAIEQFYQERNKVLYPDDLSKRIWIWVCMLKGCCKSCIRRHNVVHSWNEWERLGMPKSDALICGGSCHCHLQRRPDIKGIKIEKSPDDLQNLRTRQRTKKEVKQVKDDIVSGKIRPNFDYVERKIKEINKRDITIAEKREQIIAISFSRSLTKSEYGEIFTKYLKG